MADLTPPTCSTCGADRQPADNGADYTYCPHCDRQHLQLAVYCARCRAARVNADRTPPS